MNQDLQIRIDTAINAKDSAKTVGELRKAIKDLQSLGLEVGETYPEAFKKISIAAGSAKDRINDVREAAAAVDGEPIERLGGSFNLVSDGVRSLDFNKAITGVKLFSQSFKDFKPGDVSGQIKELTKSVIDLGKGILTSIGDGLKDRLASLKTGFSNIGGSIKQAFGGDLSGALQSAKAGFEGLGNALKVNPIFLLATVIALIIAKFEDLKNAGGLIGKMFSAIGDVIKFVTKLITDFTDAIGLTNVEGQKQTKLFLDNKKKEIDAVTARYDAEIAMASAAGQSTIQLEQTKLQAIEKITKEQIDKLNQIRIEDGKLTDDQKKNLEELTIAYQKLKDDEITIEIRANKDLRVLNQKMTDDFRQSQINLIKDKNARAKAQTDFEIEQANRGSFQNRVTAMNDIAVIYEAKRKAAGNNAYEIARLNKQQEQAEDEFRKKSVLLDKSSEKEKQAELAKTITENNKAAFEKAVAIAKAEYDSKLNLAKRNYTDIAALDTVFSFDRLEKQTKNLSDQEALTNAYYDKEVKRKGYTQKQIKALENQREIDLKGLNVERETREKEFSDYVIALANRRNQAIADLNVLQAKSDKELLEAQINQIQVKSSIELQDKNKTAEEKVLIEQKALNEIAALNAAYRDKLNAAELQAVQSKIDITNAELANEEKAGGLRITGRINLLNKLKDLEIESLRDLARQRIALIDEQQTKELSSTNATGAEKDAIIVKYANQRKDVEESTSAQIKAVELDNTKAVLDAKLSSINQGLQVAQSAAGALTSLNDLITQNETQGLKKGEKASIEVQKRQFKRQKALGIVNAAINTAQGITAALGSAPPPYNIILAAITGAAGALQIAAIASKKFNPESGGDTGSSAPSIPSTGNNAAFNAPTLKNLGQNANGANTPQSANSNRVYVVESDITDSQNKVSNIQRRAKIG